MNLHDFACDACCDETETLHVHHLYYVTGREPWEYPDFALSVLCKTCHSNAHGEASNMLEFEEVISNLGVNQTVDIGFGPWDLAELVKSGMRSEGRMDFYSWLISELTEYVNTHPSL
jgi:hypothetical protein